MDPGQGPVPPTGPPSQGCAKVAGSIGDADQGHARGKPILRLSNGGASAGVQQEHGAAHLLDRGLAGAKVPGRLQAQDPIPALGGQGTE